ncbi:MAG: hypothetical protein LBS74_09615 [Oscillospiraceae bacterium]|jgi:hypothetical protein|nr:hypothetical protein [Oscillospiraceae bacterium]
MKTKALALVLAVVLVLSAASCAAQDKVGSDKPAAIEFLPVTDTGGIGIKDLSVDAIFDFFETKGLAIESVGVDYEYTGTDGNLVTYVNFKSTKAYSNKAEAIALSSSQPFFQINTKSDAYIFYNDDGKCGVYCIIMRNSGYKTEKGIKVGDTIADAGKVYDTSTYFEYAEDIPDSSADAICPINPDKMDTGDPYIVFVLKSGSINEIVLGGRYSC